MLEKIENIDWANLKHAYGSAEDVPNDINHPDLVEYSAYKT